MNDESVQLIDSCMLSSFHECSHWLYSIVYIKVFIMLSTRSVPSTSCGCPHFGEKNNYPGSSAWV